MRLSLKARAILIDLRFNLAEQDDLNKRIMRMRHLDKPQACQILKESLVLVVARQGELVSSLMREGFDPDALRGMILEEV